jgi:hypothetical protein
MGNTVPTGDYVVTLTIGNQTQTKGLRVINVEGANDVVLPSGMIIKY